MAYGKSMSGKLSSILSTLLLLLLPLLARGDQANVRFPMSDLSSWEKKSFKGDTVYTAEKEAGSVVVRAESSNAASGYFRNISLDSKKYPYINWSWKIQGVVPVADPSLKAGDDYAARVYLVFPGRLFWQTRSIVYVWSDRLPVGKIFPSPYSDRVAVVAVESGNRNAGIWRHERRNYVEDYRGYFHSGPDDPAAVAFMTDTDNTGSHALAWYGDIFFSR
jgi:hypothetical protein